MALTQEQRLHTRQELLANRQRCPLDDQTLYGALGWTPRQLVDTLDMNAGSTPAQVWLLRDFLEQAISDLGGTPVPFTVLTDHARAQSEVWFGPRNVPPTPGRGVKEAATKRKVEISSTNSEEFRTFWNFFERMRVGTAYGFCGMEYTERLLLRYRQYCAIRIRGPFFVGDEILRSAEYTVHKWRWYFFVGLRVHTGGAS